MSIDERIEYLLKVQESHEANLNRLFDLDAANEKALGKFMSRTDEVLNTMSRLTGLEGGVQ